MVRIHTPLGFLFLAVAGLSGCTKPVISQSAPPPAPVVVGRAELKSVPVEVRAIGSVEAYSTVAVKSRVTGLIATQQFREGQDVKKGDVLFTIDRKPFDVALRQTDANLARDVARSENLKVQLRRYEQLFKEGVVSREQYDQAHSEAEAADAVVRADQAMLERARIEVEYCNVLSPVNGRTGSVMVHPGNLVEANKEPALVQLEQVEPVYVSFSVPEQSLDEIRRRMTHARLAVEVETQDQQEHETGELTFVDSAVDRSTGTIRLKATFANATRRLWPGQFVKTTLRLDTLANVVVVPAVAVQSGQNGTYVFVLKGDQTVEMRPVTAGRTWAAQTVIEKGLQAGETVVTDGHLRLLPGSKVEVKEGGKP